MGSFGEKSKARCPMKGALYACLCVDLGMMDKVFMGLEEYRHCLVDDVVEILNVLCC